MNTLNISDLSLKKPQGGLIVLFLTVTIVSSLSAIKYADSFSIDWVNTFLRIFKNIFIPEIASLYAIMLLINAYQKILKINCISLDKKSIIKYELAFLPLFMLAYFIFFPITVHIRFFMRTFPNFGWDIYQTNYASSIFSLGNYLMYLPGVFFLGYTLINISLIRAFLNKDHNALIVDKPNIVNNIQIEQHNIENNLYFYNSKNRIGQTTAGTYLNLIDAKSAIGNKMLRIEDCYCFEIEGSRSHLCIVKHPEGIFRVDYTLGELETLLDPKQFFRGNRSYIINLRYFDSYLFIEQGKYLIHLKQPEKTSFVMPRAKLEPLKESLKTYLSISAQLANN